MSRLTKILKRSDGSKLPSILNMIDQQIVQQQHLTFSKRRVMQATEKFMAALRSGSKQEIQDSFDDLTEEYNLPGDRRDFYIHPSEIWSGCHRAMFYKISKIPPSNEVDTPDPKLQMIFDVGTFYHRYIQRLLRKAGILVQGEVKVLNLTMNVTGHCDGIILLVDKKFVLEIKSANGFSFNKVKENNAPLDQHVFQASIYATELNIPTIIFLYINKDTSEMLELHVDKETKLFKKWQKEAYDVIRTVNEAVQNNQVPDRLCKKPTEETANNCAYCKVCFNLK